MPQIAPTANFSTRGVGHFIAYLARDQNGLRIADPLRGISTVSENSFGSRYRSSRFAIEIRRQ